MRVHPVIDRISKVRGGFCCLEWLGDRKDDTDHRFIKFILTNLQRARCDIDRDVVISDPPFGDIPGKCDIVPCPVSACIDCRTAGIDLHPIHRYCDIGWGSGADIHRKKGIACNLPIDRKSLVYGITSRDRDAATRKVAVVCLYHSRVLPHLCSVPVSEISLIPDSKPRLLRKPRRVDVYPTVIGRTDRDIRNPISVHITDVRNDATETSIAF